jgi:hypothetical protein
LQSKLLSPAESSESYPARAGSSREARRHVGLTDGAARQRHNFGTSGAPSLTQCGCKTVPDVFGGTAQGIDFKVRIPSGCRCVSVTEQLPDDRQPKPSSGSEARMRVAEIVETHAPKASSLGNGSPWAVQICTRRFTLGGGSLAGKYERAKAV